MGDGPAFGMVPRAVPCKQKVNVFHQEQLMKVLKVRTAMAALALAAGMTVSTHPLQ